MTAQAAATTASKLMLARRLTKAKLNQTNCNNRLCSVSKNNNRVVCNKQNNALN